MLGRCLREYRSLSLNHRVEGVGLNAARKESFQLAVVSFWAFCRELNQAEAVGPNWRENSPISWASWRLLKAQNLEKCVPPGFGVWGAIPGEGG